jgi:hypothetical protein
VRRTLNLSDVPDKDLFQLNVLSSLDRFGIDFGQGIKKSLLE